ncbi:MAG: hypothetical protein O6851_02300 [Gemmatimonadetes bacterium]|nr:hypothetical protein [Gemmatimonadota bacterium]
MIKAVSIRFALLAAILPATADETLPSVAHEEAVLESSRSSVPAGAVLPLDGRDFGEGERYVLRLVGALREYELGEVEADAEGLFSIELAIPGSVTPGAYQVVAVAPDGDVTARLDLVVLKAEAAEPEGAEERPASEAAQEAAPRVARADEMPIERSRSGLEWGVIGLLIAGAGGLGLGLIKKS